MFENHQAELDSAHTTDFNGGEHAPQEPVRPAGAEETDGLSTAAGDAFDPEAYDGLAFPDGVSVSKDVLGEFKALAREMNLSPENAQRLIDLEAKAGARAGADGEAVRQEILQRWADKTKELFGPGYEKEVDVALRAADAFGGAELRDLLEATGLGNHPVVVKTFNQIGRRMGEDEWLGGAAARGSDKTFTEALYGVKSN